MFAYRVFGHRLVSGIALRCPPRAGFGGPEPLGTIRFQLRSRTAHDQPLESPDVTQTSPGGGPFAEIGRDADGYVARYVGVAAFHARLDPLVVTAAALPQTTMDTIEHLLLDQVIPRLLPLAGAGTVLHSSAASLAGAAVVFIAPSRSGKSTLVTHLARNGFELLSDDSVLLAGRGNAFHAFPSYPAVRLWRDSAGELLPDAPLETVSQYNSKRRAGAGAGMLHRDTAAELRAIVVLSNRAADAVSLEPLAAHLRFPALLEASMRMEVRDPAVNRAEFLRLAQLAESVPMLELAYPRRYDALPEAAAAIAAIARQ